MKQGKYMGLDVHQAMTVAVVLDAEGKVVLETMVATEAAAILRLVQSLSGPLRVRFEETTQAEWLHEVLRRHVTEVVVCDPRRNKLLSEGSKGDKVDARKLADLLRTGMLRSVYHGHEATKKLKELVRAYETFSIDTQRTMARIKAIYRGRGIATPGRGVYQVKQLGPVRAALLVATVDTPHRFRTKRQFWSYVGLAVVTHMSAEYEMKAEKSYDEENRWPPGDSTTIATGG